MNEKLKQYIADYDSGKPMETVSMGGISEGYEIAIQMWAIEILRILQHVAVPKDKDVFGNLINVVADVALEPLNVIYGYTGAQAGAAKNMAAVFWRQGPENALQMMRNEDPKRMIWIVKKDNTMAIVEGNETAR